MIHDVDETLREIARRDVINGSNVDISFEAPTTEWAARRNVPALNMYLYDIHEDIERRRGGTIEIRGDDGLVTDRRPPPRYYKLSYPVTARTQRPPGRQRPL